MWHDLTFQTKDGSVATTRYNTTTSELVGFEPDGDTRKWKVAPKVSKDKPLGKTRAPKVLKIQLGLACNFTCVYCNQSSQIEDATISTLADVHKFLEQLDGWIEGEPDEIQLWGGEPFVYWAKIKLLLPELRKRYPNTHLAMVTNGSMFTQERVDWIIQYDIYLAISHDGPGQHQRGPDPLKDPDTRAWIKYLMKEREGKIAFSAVLTKNYHDLAALRKWFDDNFEEGCQVGLEGVVNAYDSATLYGTGKFDDEKLHSLRESVFLSAVNDEESVNLYHSVNAFITSLMESRPLYSVGQSCGMDRPEHISLDLGGNVMTCQNTGAQGEHAIGHVDDFDNIKLTTSTHFDFRDECLSCPVVQLCKGSCMFLEDKFFEQTCKNEFAFNFGIMQAALFKLSGMYLVKTEISKDQD